MGKTVLIIGAPEKFANYQKAVEAAGGQVAFSGGLEAVRAAYDAVILPGGGDMEPWRYGEENTASHNLEPERDAAELALLAQCAEAGTPVLGICRGFQVINVFFGGSLLQDIPGHSATEGVDGQHEVWTAPSPLRDLYGETMTVNSAHHQAVGRLGQGLEIVQRSKDGIPEALVHQALPIWAVQWHPERFGSVGLQLIGGFLKRADSGFFAKSFISP